MAVIKISFIVYDMIFKTALCVYFTDPRIQNWRHKTEHGSDARARREQEIDQTDVGYERKTCRLRG